MPLQRCDGATSIRVVFEEFSGAFRAHTVAWYPKDDEDNQRVLDATLTNIRRSVFRDFQDCVMDSLANVEIQGAVVTFDKLENSEYATSLVEPLAA